jgi:hypothetical protein
MKMAVKGLVGARQKKHFSQLPRFASPWAMKGSCLEGETGEDGRGKQKLLGKCDYSCLAPAIKRSFSDFVGTDERATRPHSKMQPTLC